MTGTPSMAASSISAEAQAGFAAAGHADADCVRHQIARVVEERLVQGLAGGEIVAAAEVEEAKLFEGLRCRREGR